MNPKTFPRVYFAIGAKRNDINYYNERKSDFFSKFFERNSDLIYISFRRTKAAPSYNDAPGMNVIIWFVQ